MSAWSEWAKEHGLKYKAIDLIATVDSLRPDLPSGRWEYPVLTNTGQRVVDTFWDSESQALVIEIEGDL